MRPSCALLRRLLLAALLLPALCVASGSDRGADLVEPSPQLTPAQAVRAQLRALEHNDEPTPNAGIARVWRFSSPGNRAQTGPLARFTLMVHKGYAELLNHRRATLATLAMDGDQAFQGVDIVDHDGAPHRFVFVLSRQTAGPCQGCWLTDAVVGAPDDTPRVTASLRHGTDTAVAPANRNALDFCRTRGRGPGVQGMSGRAGTEGTAQAETRTKGMPAAPPLGKVAKAHGQS